MTKENLDKILESAREVYAASKCIGNVLNDYEENCKINSIEHHELNTIDAELTAVMNELVQTIGLELLRNPNYVIS